MNWIRCGLAIAISLLLAEMSLAPDAQALGGKEKHSAQVACEVFAQNGDIISLPLPKTIARLVQAGATAEGAIVRNDDGDELGMVRDPWGFAVQLVKRAKAML